MNTLDLYRTGMTVAALMAAGINTGLAVAVWRHRGLVFHATVWVLFALAVAASAGSGAYWRVHDTRVDVPLNVGDFTVFLPTLGGFVAGMYAWRILGRIVGATEGTHDD